jgi:hypothetical protein
MRRRSGIARMAGFYLAALHPEHSSIIDALRQNATVMRTVKLEHNDDTALDPADPELVMRGSILLDGHAAGSWEQRRDGTWIARLNATGETFSEPGRPQLIERLAHSS